MVCSSRSLLQIEQHNPRKADWACRGGDRDAAGERPGVPQMVAALTHNFSVREFGCQVAGAASNAAADIQDALGGLGGREAEHLVNKVQLGSLEVLLLVASLALSLCVVSQVDVVSPVVLHQSLAVGSPVKSGRWAVCLLQAANDDAGICRRNRLWLTLSRRHTHGQRLGCLGHKCGKGCRRSS